MANPHHLNLQIPPTILTTVILILLLLLQTHHHSIIAQQPYLDNKQLDCQNTKFPFTQGNSCSNTTTTTTCLSYVTFRTTTVYDSPSTIAHLLNSDPSLIVRLNNLPSDVSTLPQNTLLIVPNTCSCTLTKRQNHDDYYYYQHNASYVLKNKNENYYTLANNTFEGLTTCQALISQNPYDYKDLSVGMNIFVPLRCACPSQNQKLEGFKYLLSYLVTWGDSVDYIAELFGANTTSVLIANELKEDSVIFPFTPILVPLKSEPVLITTSPPSPPTTSPTVPVKDGKGKSSSRSSKWVFICIGIGGGVIVFAALFVFLFCFFRIRKGDNKPEEGPIGGKKFDLIPPDSKSWPVSFKDARFAVGSLTAYEFEDLEKATGNFDEANRIKGSVYRGSFKGDVAAVKVMRGDVSEEIGILKQINHSNIVRLSGFCVHDENTYLIYEYADNGSLDDWLRTYMKQYDSVRVLGWKQRVRIACDVADALNYLHNYASPPYIHKNLKSSNILLAGDFRAKVSNFGLARSLGEDREDLQMTRHVVGTYGYMAPEYIENGLVTPKLDVFSFGVVLLEILSGKEAANRGGEKEGKEGDSLLCVSIREVLEGEDVRGKLKDFVDPCLGKEYPFDLAFSLAELAKNCVDNDLNCRPSMGEVLLTLSKISSSSMDWDPSYEELDEHSRSLSRSR